MGDWRWISLPSLFMAVVAQDEGGDAALGVALKGEARVGRAVGVEKDG